MDISKYLQFLKGSKLVMLIMGIPFCLAGLAVNFVQGILYFTVRPFNKDMFRKINWYMTYTIFAQITAMFDWWSQSEMIFYGDKKMFDKYFGKEHAYIIMNHCYEIDWIMGLVVADQASNASMLGNIKAYTKTSVQYLPVLGWAFKFGEFVFLERNFDKDKIILNKSIAELASHPDPMWLAIFPEGTRFTQEKQIASAEFATKNNLPELKYHLQPRTRGFITSLPPMRGKVPAIYNIELAFKDDAPFKPTLTNLLLGNPIVAHLHIQRIPLEEVPEDPQEQEKFLRDIYLQKDKLMKSFVETGIFFTTSGVPREDIFKVKPRLYSLFNLILWQLSVLIPIFYYLVKFMLNGEFFYLFTGAVIIGLSGLLLFKTIGMTEMKKASTYGSGTATNRSQ